MPAVPMHRPSDYNPADPYPRPCWTCAWWDGMCAQGTAAKCGRSSAAKVAATPERGCVFWEREPGADDEPLTRQRMSETWAHLVWPEPSLSGGLRPRR